MLSSFTENTADVPLGAGNCFTYKNLFLNSLGEDISSTIPSLMSISGQSMLNFANSGAGSIQHSPSKVFEFYLNGSIAITGSPLVMSALVSITLMNECLNAVADVNIIIP